MLDSVPPMTGYSTKEAANLLELSVAQLLAFVRAGFLTPRRGHRGRYVFLFQDLVLLRAAKALVQAQIPSRRVRAALKQLALQLPEGQPLSGVHIAAEGDQIVVRSGDELWNPESGQVLFDFGVSELSAKVAPLVRARVEAARRDEGQMTGEDWYQLGCDLELTSAEQAREAYRRALELEPAHVDVRLNLGRLLHEAGLLPAAEAQYRAAIDGRPDDAVAWFNLGVALEDQEKTDEAIEAYRLAIELDPDIADAYYNLGQLYERSGRVSLAHRYLTLYRRLTDQR